MDAGGTSNLRRRRLNRAAAAAASGVLLGTVACWPVTTRYGVDYQVSSRTIPLYEKAANFLSRDLQTRRLAAEVTAGAAGDDDKLLRIFEWVGRNVRPTPAGFPIIDDHVLHIVIRGYGETDQRTEAFALLASYSGLPATGAILREPGGSGLYIALVQSQGRLIPVDVVNHLVFRLPQTGELADIDALQAHPDVVAAQAAGRKVRNVPYQRYFADIGALRPAFERMEAQKPWPRLKNEIARVFGRQ